MARININYHNITAPQYMLLDAIFQETVKNSVAFRNLLVPMGASNERARVKHEELLKKYADQAAETDKFLKKLYERPTIQYGHSTLSDNYAAEIVLRRPQTDVEYLFKNIMIDLFHKRYDDDYSPPDDHIMLDWFVKAYQKIYIEHCLVLDPSLKKEDYPEIRVSHLAAQAVRLNDIGLIEIKFGEAAHRVKLPSKFQEVQLAFLKLTTKGLLQYMYCRGRVDLECNHWALFSQHLMWKVAKDTNWQLSGVERMDPEVFKAIYDYHGKTRWVTRIIMNDVQSRHHGNYPKYYFDLMVKWRIALDKLKVPCWKVDSVEGYSSRQLLTVAQIRTEMKRRVENIARLAGGKLKTNMIEGLTEGKVIKDIERVARSLDPEVRFGPADEWQLK